MNTCLRLKYRDANGDSWHDYVIINGAITQAQIDTIRENLEESQCIANEIGLTSPANEAFEIKGGYTESDHVYTVLTDFEDNDELTPSDMHTTENAFHDFDITEIVSRFEQSSIDIEKELTRISSKYIIL